MRHSWDYGGLEPREAHDRTCRVCGMNQYTSLPGICVNRRWDWRLRDEETWHTSILVPGCEVKAAGVWQRIEDDEGPGWEISNPCGDGRDYQVTDEVIRVFGARPQREYLERKGIPAMPPEAQKVAR
jgi:hypothetical protein